ncbi:MAG: hypothetical protein AAFU55_00505 [Pseudomonadota bacterium]
MANVEGELADLDERRRRLDQIPDDDPDLRAGRTYLDRILDAYSDMRWSTRSLIQARPSEARLLFLALLSDVIFFVARSMSMVVAPPQEVALALPAQVGLGVIVAFLIRTSLFYITAVLAKIVSIPFGGKGSWYETRCAVFWAALVSAPIEFFGALVTVGVVYARPHAAFLDTEWLVEAPYFIGPIAFGFFLSAGVAEAQGFRYTYRVMAVLAILTIALVWGVLSLGIS